MRPENAALSNTSDMGSRMIEEDVTMSGPSAQPRILFVTPEVIFMPEGTGNSFFQLRLIYHKSFGNGTLPNRFAQRIL
jgi:hypothetical protein